VEEPARDARAEALAHARRLRGANAEVLILEPAPPAVNEPPWFADREPQGERVVAPFGAPHWRWATLAAEDPALVRWCEAGWLGPYRRLEALPADFAATRAALHELAKRVISPARERANGKIGLRYTRGGFGTPFFGPDAQVRVEGATLVVTERGRGRRAAITSVAGARELLGGLAAADPGSDAGALTVDAGASLALGELYGFATSVLAELRFGARELEPSRVQLWPEHFDVSLELGSEADGRRATCGVSPGDGEHAEPYLYVAPWAATPAGERWQARGFAGAELDYGELLGLEDQRGAALDFYRGRLAEL
jgi:hypothetical protein